MLHDSHEMYMKNGRCKRCIYRNLEELSDNYNHEIYEAIDDMGEK